MELLKMIKMLYYIWIALGNISVCCLIKNYEKDIERF